MPSPPAPATAGHEPEVPDLARDMRGDILLATPRAAWIAVEHEVVIYVVDAAMTFVLNPTAALLWQCLDGESTLGEILTDVAEAFGVDEHVAYDEFAPVVQQWIEVGLAARGA